MLDPELDGIPPQDLDAEQAVLGSIILGSTKTLEEVAAVLSPSDFYRTAHQHIYSASIELYRERQEVDLVTLAGHLRAKDRLDAIGGLDYLDRLMRSTPYSTNAPHYASIVRDRSIKRDLLWSSHKIRTLAQDGNPAEVSTSEALDVLNTVAQAQRSTGDDWRSTALIEACDREILGYCDPIPTGFPTLDELLGGGWVRKQVHILTARPGEGKSALVCKFMLSAIKAGKVPGIISREMSRNEVVCRLVSLHSGVWLSNMHPRQNFRDSYDRDLFTETRKWIAERCVVQHSRKVTVADMDRLLHRMVLREKCDILFVDLLDRITGEGSSELEQLNSINKRLQDMADPDDLGVPVILVQQQNEKQNPSPSKPALAFAKGTGETVDNSSVVIGFMRERNSPGDVAKGSIHVLKNRGGREKPLGFPVYGEWQTMDWYEAEAASPSQKRAEEEDDDDPFDCA